MKKIFTTFFTLILFIGFLLLPIFVSAYTSVMDSHHGKSISPCLEHCLSSIDYSEEITLGSILGNFGEVLIQKLFLHELVLFIIPHGSLYCLIYYGPPNLFRKIKNYNYSQLRGIVITTT